MDNDQFAAMRDIGGLYGLSSHDVGRYLKQHDYRNAQGKPTRKAIDAEMVREKLIDGYFAWHWHVDRTSSFLESLGRKRRTSSPGEVAE